MIQATAAARQRRGRPQCGASVDFYVAAALQSQVVITGLQILRFYVAAAPGTGPLVVHFDDLGVLRDSGLQVGALGAHPLGGKNHIVPR